MAATQSKQGNGARFVTWGHLLAGLGIMFAALGSLNTFVWAQHSAHPHDGAVTEQEMRQFEKRNEAQFSYIKDRLDKIDRKLDK